MDKTKPATMPPPVAPPPPTPETPDDEPDVYAMTGNLTVEQVPGWPPAHELPTAPPDEQAARQEAAMSTPSALVD